MNVNTSKSLCQFMKGSVCHNKCAIQREKGKVKPSKRA